jgi:hypothetical protein
MEVAMKRIALLHTLLIALPFFLFGCYSPKVSYHAQDNFEKNYIPFALMASRVTISLPEPAKDGDKAEKKIAAQDIGKTKPVSMADLQNTQALVTATQAKGTLRYLEPYEQELKLSKTDISITYFDGMKVPKTIGVFVEDNTVKVISALGAVGGALAVFATPAQQSIQLPRDKKDLTIVLPIVLDFSNPDDFRTYGKEQCRPIGAPNAEYGYCFTLTEKEGRKTTVTYDKFFNDYENKYTRNVPFSRCVDVTILIKKWNIQQNKVVEGDALATYNSVIADPYHIDWLPLPQKGSITSQGTCDANSTSEKSDNPSAYDMLEEVGKQVDAVWKAWHPKKDEQ